MLDDKIKLQLVDEAAKAKENSYAPYSKFHVGAAVLGEDGKIYKGCNIENASYSATVCAERTAIYKGITEGNKVIKAIAIVSDSNDFTYPCGICRQVIAEFSEDVVIILRNLMGNVIETDIKQLLPNSFTKKDLEKSQEVKK